MEGARRGSEVSAHSRGGQERIASAARIEQNTYGFPRPATPSVQPGTAAPSDRAHFRDWPALEGTLAHLPSRREQDVNPHDAG